MTGFLLKIYFLVNKLNTQKPAAAIKPIRMIYEAILPVLIKIESLVGNIVFTVVKTWKGPIEFARLKS